MPMGGDADGKEIRGGKETMKQTDEWKNCTVKFYENEETGEQRIIVSRETDGGGNMYVFTTYPGYPVRKEKKP